MLTIQVASHPVLDVGAFVARSTAPFHPFTSSAPPLSTDETVKAAVRDLLRAGGFKPSGRSKPASEYLLNNPLPVINPIVDACNLVSLHSGLPISIVDLDKLAPGPLAIRCAEPGTSHVFNSSGQVLDTGGLLALFDGEGSTGTPVKDAQRTKTHDESRAVLAIIWGTTKLPGRTAAATSWYRELLISAGATIEDVGLTTAP